MSRLTIQLNRKRIILLGEGKSIKVTGLWIISFQESVPFLRGTFWLLSLSINKEKVQEWQYECVQGILGIFGECGVVFSDLGVPHCWAALSSSLRGHPCCPPLPIPATYTQCKYQNNSMRAQQVSVHRTAAWRLPQFLRACTGGCRELSLATLVELESWMCSETETKECFSAFDVKMH